MAEKKEKDIYALLAASLDKKAVQRTKGKDTHKGYDTTGYGYQYIINRFNEVCGLDGWGYTWAILRDEEGAFANKKPAYDITVRLEITVGESSPRAHIGSHVSANYGDAVKGAITNAIKKVAAMYGVGRQAYEDSIDDDNETQKQGAKDVQSRTEKPAADPGEGIGDPGLDASMHENLDSLTNGELTLVSNWAKSHLFGPGSSQGNAKEAEDLATLRTAKNTVELRKGAEWWWGPGYKGGGERDKRLALEEGATKKPLSPGATTLAVKRAEIETLLKPLTCPERPTEDEVLMSLTDGEAGNVADLTNNDVLRIHTELSK